MRYTQFWRTFGALPSKNLMMSRIRAVLWAVVANTRKMYRTDFLSRSVGHDLAIGVGVAKAGWLREATERVIVLLGDHKVNEGRLGEAAGYARGRLTSQVLRRLTKGSA